MLDILNLCLTVQFLSQKYLQTSKPLMIGILPNPKI